MGCKKWQSKVGAEFVRIVMHVCVRNIFDSLECVVCVLVFICMRASLACLFSYESARPMWMQKVCAQMQRATRKMCHVRLKKGNAGSRFLIIGKRKGRADVSWCIPVKWCFVVCRFTFCPLPGCQSASPWGRCVTNLSKPFTNAARNSAETHVSLNVTWSLSTVCFANVRSSAKMNES